MNTKQRFRKGERISEMRFMERIVNLLSRTPEFTGLDKNIIRIIPHTEHKDIQDLMIYFRMGLHENAISIELQQRTLEEFNKYKQIVLDYVSAYKPAHRYFKIDDFKSAIAQNKIRILKKGKLEQSGARILVFYTFDENNDRLDHIYIYDLNAISARIKEIEEKGDFRTNIKSGSENWGSAFIAVYPELLESCRIKSHQELMKIVLPKLF